MKSISKFRRLFLGLTICFLVAAFSPASWAADVDNLTILDYGIYETQFEEWQTAPKTANGKIGIVTNRKILEFTDAVAASTGTEFGIRYVLTGPQEGKPVDLLVRVLHSDVNSTRVTASEEWLTRKHTGTPCFDGWKLGTDLLETPQGLTIQLFHKGRKLAEKTFTVYPQNTPRSNSISGHHSPDST